MRTYRPASAPAYRPGLPASEVHSSLREAVAEMRHAERNAVLWFSEVLRRKLYRELGHASIHDYASQALGFSQSKTYQFIKLSGSLESLPKLRQAILTGDVTWTKARGIVGVATAKTEEDWVEKAKTSSRRELEQKVAETKRRATAVRKSGVRRREAAGQKTLDLSTPAGSVAAGSVAAGSAAAGSATLGSATSGSAVASSRPNGGAADGITEPGTNAAMNSGVPDADMATEVPVTVQLRLSPIQYARLAALTEKARKLGHHEPREELILAGLESLVTTQTLRTKAARRAKASRRAGAKDPAKAKGRAKATATSSATDRAKGSLQSTDTRRSHGSDGDAAPDHVVYLNSPYQVVVYRCESCGKAHVPTSQGERTVDMATLEAMLCDAQICAPGTHKRSAIPPSVRRRVFERDGYRCTVAGCGSTHDLIIHHDDKVEFGGSNDIKNLRTMCGSCHRWLHRKEWTAERVRRMREAARETAAKAGRKTAGETTRKAADKIIGKVSGDSTRVQNRGKKGIRKNICDSTRVQNRANTRRSYRGRGKMEGRGRYPRKGAGPTT